MRALGTAVVVLGGGALLGWLLAVATVHILLAPARAILRALIGGI